MGRQQLVVKGHLVLVQSMLRVGQLPQMELVGVQEAGRMGMEILLPKEGEEGAGVTPHRAQKVECGQELCNVVKEWEVEQ
jgi:hypothetical protein